LISPEELYRKTGIQFMRLNTIFQLFAHKELHPEDFHDSFMLMMPDALYYLFTGKISCEYTEASTSNLLNAAKQDWDWDIISKLGFEKKFFPTISLPGSAAGNLSPSLRNELGCGNIPFYHVGSHDTASAVASVPVLDENHLFAYISCGTWALLGTELSSPVLSDEAKKANYTNEGGVSGKIRFLTNITGLWLLQECKRIWDSRGEKYSYQEMVEMGKKAEPLRFLLNPTNEKFLAPENMPDSIRKYCLETGQGEIPDTPSLIRCVIDSMALSFREKIAELETLTAAKYQKVHIIGGGSQNTLLMQCAADYMRRDVCAGPVEATAIGNLMVQGMASGTHFSLADARKIIASSFPSQIYKASEIPLIRMENAVRVFKNLP
jgi:sugar (pentulose or hexulose) kinase